MTTWNVTENEMTHRAVTVRPDDNLYHAFAIMRRSNFRHLPVVDKGELVGILSDRDIFRSSAMRSGSLVISQGTVADAMSRGVFTCKATDRIGDVADEMLRRKIDAMPVIDDAGRVTGIITSTDLLHHVRRLSGVRDTGAWLEDHIAMIEGTVPAEDAVE